MFNNPLPTADRPERVYMDNHATTRVDPRVVEAMLPYFTEEYGNAGSTGHAFGDAAREAVEEARATIAAAIGAEPREVVFTSGATESNNLAIRGVATRPRRRGDHLVSVLTEHEAVLDPLARLGHRGPRGDTAAGRAARLAASGPARSAASSPMRYATTPAWRRSCWPTTKSA